MGEFGEITGLQTGFGSLAEAFPEQILRGGEFRFTTAVVALIGYKRAKPLAAEDDAFAFQFLVGTLDRDDAHEQILRKLPEGRQRRAGPEPTLTDLALQPVNDLLIKRPSGGG